MLKWRGFLGRCIANIEMAGTFQLRLQRNVEMAEGSRGLAGLRDAV
jgi:hypothetical protein